jgi:hypothetical protein
MGKGSPPQAGDMLPFPIPDGRGGLGGEGKPAPPSASRPNTGTITSYMRSARFLTDGDGMARPKETRTSMTEAAPQVTVYTTNT